MGILGLGAVGIMRMNDLSVRSSKSAEIRNEVNYLVMEMRNLLMNPDDCQKSFIGLDATNSGTINNLKDRNGDIKIEVDKPYGSSKLKISTLKLIDNATDDVEVVSGSSGSTNLIATFDRGEKTLGGRYVSKQIKLNVNVDGSNVIESCFSGTTDVASSSSNSSLWIREPSTPSNIFYDAGSVNAKNGLNVTGRLVQNSSNDPNRWGYSLQSTNFGLYAGLKTNQTGSAIALFESNPLAGNYRSMTTIGNYGGASGLFSSHIIGVQSVVRVVGANSNSVGMQSRVVDSQDRIHSLSHINTRGNHNMGFSTYVYHTNNSRGGSFNLVSRLRTPGSADYSASDYKARAFLAYRSGGNYYGGYFRGRTAGYFSGTSQGIVTNTCSGCSVISEMMEVLKMPENGSVMCVDRESGKLTECQKDSSKKIIGIAQEKAEMVLRVGCEKTKLKKNSSNNLRLGVKDVKSWRSLKECRGWYPIAVKGLSEGTKVLCESPKGIRLGHGDLLVSSDKKGFLRPIDEDEEPRSYQVVGKAMSKCKDHESVGQIHVWIN